MSKCFRPITIKVLNAGCCGIGQSILLGFRTLNVEVDKKLKNKKLDELSEDELRILAYKIFCEVIVPEWFLKFLFWIVVFYILLVIIKVILL